MLKTAHLIRTPTKNRQFRKFALVWTLCCASGFLADASLAAEPETSTPARVRAQITGAFDSDGKPEGILSIGKHIRHILFGSDPETMRFRGQVRGIAPSVVRYYWTFDNRTPSRFPDQGVSDRSDSRLVKFTSAGTVHFHVVDKDHPETDLAEDTVVMCQITFERLPDRDETGKVARDNEGNPILDYIPAGATVDRNGAIESRTDWILRTAPPLKDCYLGRVVTSKPKTETVLPPYAVTDSSGCFHFGVSAMSADGDRWGSIKLVDSPLTQEPAQIRRLAEKNRTILREDEPIDATITADPVTLYKVGVDDKRESIEAILAFRLHFSLGDLQRLPAIHGVKDGVLTAYLSNPKRKHQNQIVHYRLPEALSSTLKSVSENNLAGYMWYHESDKWRAEDGNYYLQIPKVQRVVYQPGNPPNNGGEEIEAVTFLPRNGLLVAIIVKSGVDNDWLMGINASSGKVEWETPVSGVDAVARLTWINDDLILGTLYGRRSSEYSIISISNKKAIASGSASAGAQYVLSNGALVDSDPGTHNIRRLFTFPPHGERAH